MTKFGDVISKARAAKEDVNQKAAEAENQNAAKPASWKDQPASASAVETISPDDTDLAVSAAESEPFVNLSVRVPKRLRQHWAAEAKRSGTTLTKVISDALHNMFGEP